MKAVVVFMAVVAAAVAHPADLSKVNWEESKKDFHEVHDLVKESQKFIVEEAKAGNAEIGAEVDTYVKNHHDEFMKETDVSAVETGINNHTLQYDEAKEYFTHLAHAVAELKTGIAEITAKLPAHNAENIANKIQTVLARIGELKPKYEKLYGHMSETKA